MHSHNMTRLRETVTHRWGRRLGLHEAAVGGAVTDVEAREPTTICADRDGGERAIEPVRGRDGSFFIYLYQHNSHMGFELPLPGRWF